MMTDPLSIDKIVFPGFGLEFSVDKEAFVIFGLSIKWYGIIIALGMLLAVSYCFKRTREFGIDDDKLTDAAFAGGIAAVIGARLYYVALHAESYKTITDVLAIRDGGLAIYGGIIGALLIGCITAKIRKLRILPMLDIVSMGFLIGQGVGRWGNFFNQEAFGCNTALPWGMSGGRIQRYLVSHRDMLALQGMDIDPYMTVHPCFLYESLWCLAGFLILHFYHKKRKFDGECFCIYAFWYGLGRFFIEGLRTDSLYIGSIKASQALALVTCITAAAIIIIMRIHIKKKPAVLYRDTEESKQIIAEIDKAEAEEKQRAERKKAAKKSKTTEELSEEDKII